MPVTFKRPNGDAKLAVSVKQVHFMGGAHIGDRRVTGVTNILRGLAIDHARQAVVSTDVQDFTDSSGGTVLAATVALVVPTAAFDGQSSGAAPGSAFDTAANALENAFAVMADTYNQLASRLGLPAVVFTTGTVAGDNTIASLTKTLSATNGATAIDFTTGIAAMDLIKNNYATIHSAYDDIANALGMNTLADNSGGFPTRVSRAMSAVANVLVGTGGSAGETSIDDTVMDTFLTAVADNIATLAASYSDMMFQEGVADLTDSVGGTASDAIADLGTMTAHEDVSTNSSPKAGFDSEIVKWRKDMAECLVSINALAAFHDTIEPLTDSTAGTADGTAGALLVALAAVDGTGGNSLEVASALVTWDNVKDNIATLVARVNELAPFYGLPLIVDSGGGTVSTTVVVAMAASATGVDNGSAATGVADAEVDANLVVLRNAVKSIVTKLNLMTGTLGQVATAGVAGLPLCVVAAV